MATLIHPIPRGRMVGALACQRDSYLQALDAEVVSCVKWSPTASTHNAKQKTKTPADSGKTQASTDIWLVEFTDSVLFPEGMKSLTASDLG